MILYSFGICNTEKKPKILGVSIVDSPVFLSAMEPAELFVCDTRDENGPLGFE